jgi:glucosamine--fructose-6-phosphate aminotransferase (isomerizing)
LLKREHNKLIWDQTEIYQRSFFKMTDIAKASAIKTDVYETHTLQEILTQPDAWRAALQEVQIKQEALKALWNTRAFSEILVTGCGSTHYLSQAVAPLLQQELGIRARAVPASELLLFPETLETTGGRPLLFTISRSGRTSETIRATEAYKARHQEPVLTVGCYPEAELVALSDLALVISEGQEQSVVQTRSFSAMLVAAQAAIALLNPARFEAMQGLPALGERLIATYHQLAKQLGEDKQFERIYFLGSGLQYGLASEGNLKMKEMSLSIAEAFHFMEFRHGPMSMVNERTLVVGLLSDKARDYELAVLREMRALGARTLVLSEQAVSSAEADYQVNFNSGLPEASRGVLYLPVLQLFGYYRARANGQNPDQPHNLTAVVVLEGAHES